MDTVCIVKFIPITYIAIKVKELYVIDINMILHTVYTMFVDFKNWMLGYIEGKLVRNTSRIPGL